MSPNKQSSEQGAPEANCLQRPGSAELHRAMAEVQRLRDVLISVAQRIEDSKYYGSVIARGPSLMLMEIARECRVNVELSNDYALIDRLDALWREYDGGTTTGDPPNAGDQT